MDLPTRLYDQSDDLSFPSRVCGGGGGGDVTWWFWKNNNAFKSNSIVKIPVVLRRYFQLWWGWGGVVDKNADSNFDKCWCGCHNNIFFTPDTTTIWTSCLISTEEEMTKNCSTKSMMKISQNWVKNLHNLKKKFVIPFDIFFLKKNRLKIGFTN